MRRWEKATRRAGVQAPKGPSDACPRPRRNRRARPGESGLMSALSDVSRRTSSPRSGPECCASQSLAAISRPFAVSVRAKRPPGLYSSTSCAAPCGSAPESPSGQSGSRPRSSIRGASTRALSTVTTRLRPCRRPTWRTPRISTARRRIITASTPAPASAPAVAPRPSPFRRAPSTHQSSPRSSKRPRRTSTFASSPRRGRIPFPSRTVLPLPRR
jgi:hypothetical protein